MARNYDVDQFDEFDDFDDLDDLASRPPRPRRSRPTWDVTDPDPELPDGATRSTYQESRAAQGPLPPPSWLVTSSAAIDVDRGVVRTGKEADIHLVERTDPGTGASCLLVDKRYRSQQHRMFHRDAAYLEGRRVRRSRENRAIANRTAFGRQVIAGQWASAEFGMLSTLWSAGVAVPYPVQLGGTSMLIEFIGDPDGTAAPQLAELRPDGDELDDLWRQCRETLASLAAIGFTHGDLSAFNVIVHDGRFLLIDLPQVVDVVVNPQGPTFLRRDCENICGWFQARGLAAADPVGLADDLAVIAGTTLEH